MKLLINFFIALVASSLAASNVPPPAQKKPTECFPDATGLRKLPAHLDALAGGLAAVITKATLYPLDTLKTWRMARPHGEISEFIKQCFPPRDRDAHGLWRRMTMGSRVYRGLGPKLMFYFPYQSLYQVFYSQSKEATLPYLPLPLAVGVSGAAADIGASIVRLPMEVIKQRMQSGVYTSLPHSLKSIVTEEGLVQFYRGTFVPQTLLHDVPFSAIGWMCYETCMDAAGDRDTFSPTKSFAIGALASTIATTITNPLDVIKTRILTARRTPPPMSPWHWSNWYTIFYGRGVRDGDRLKGVAETYREILVTEGRSAFFRGFAPRLLHIVPAHAMTLALLEWIRLSMSERIK